MDDGINEVYEYYKNQALLEELLREAERQQATGFKGVLL